MDGAVLYGLFGEEWFVNMRKHFPALEEYVGKMKGSYASFLEEMDGVARAAGKPFMVMSFLSQASDAISKLTSLDIPVYPSARRCASAMRALLKIEVGRRCSRSAGFFSFALSSVGAKLGLVREAVARVSSNGKRAFNVPFALSDYH